MRELSPGEILQLREFLMMETTNLVTMKAAEQMISNERLKTACSTGIQACEARIRSMQQFIQENGVESIQEVH